MTREGMARKLWIPLCLFAAGASLLAAAAFTSAAGGTSDRERGADRRGGTLRLASPVDAASLDTALGYTPREWAVFYATCAKLFNYPDAEGLAGTRLVKEIVKDYTVSNAGRTYTFDLHPTFRFHTGARVTAQSFADAFHRDARLKQHSPAAPYLREIAGAAAVLDGSAETISGVRVLAPYRLRIELTRRTGDFIARLTMPMFCPVLPNTSTAELETSPGSGPYYVAERIPNRRILLKRNPYYRGTRPANVDEIVWEIGGNRALCLEAVEADRVDHCVRIFLSDEQARRLAAKYGITRRGEGQFRVAYGFSTYFFAFNHRRPAFAGPGQIPLKKAINFAIDRRAIAGLEKWGFLSSRRTDQMVAPPLAADASVYPITGAAIAKARKWLAKAKWKPDKLVLRAPTGLVAETGIFTYNLKRIGIDVEVKVVGLDDDERASNDWDVTFGAWGPDYPDAQSYFVFLFGYYGIRTHDGRMARLDKLPGEARRDAWARFDAELMRDDPPWAPYLHESFRILISKSFGCFIWHPVYSVDYAAACKK
jgi:ABC-type oligopeptide transport system substrate-binding subunit